MKKSLFLLASFSLVLTACDQYRGTSSTNTDRTDRTERTERTERTDTNTRADNTGRNVRDRSGQTLTPGDQPENEADRTVTQRVRQIIIEDDALSTNAKNVKIITINGVVTLRGVVNNDREKNIIGQKARSINGVRNVDNQLEIVRSEEVNGSQNQGQARSGDRLDTNRNGEFR